MPLPPRLSAEHRPTAVALELPEMTESIRAVESELGRRAAQDRHGCCGYFPALEGITGIDSDLPACRAFGECLPSLYQGGADYGFNFVRLSLTRQSTDPTFHLDTDAATALSGDVTTLGQRQVARLLLNLGSRRDRVLHYLDVDAACVDLVSDGSYVRVADPGGLMERARTLVIPARRGPRLSGLAFVANAVLHSGVDDADGHFVAAYGTEATVNVVGSARPAWNAPSTSSRSVLRAAGCSVCPNMR